MFNSIPSVQNPTMITSPTDEASKIVGYNIDNYVFGSDSYTPQNQNSMQTQSTAPNKNNGSLLGALTLGGIIAAGIALAKGIFKK